MARREQAMNDFTLTYLQLIEEDTEEIAYYKSQIDYFEEILKKRTFDVSYSVTLSDLIDDLRMAIKEEINECLYYIQRIKELRNANKINEGNSRIDKKGFGE